MIKEREVIFKLTVKAYYDGDFDQDELQQKLMDTLKNDNWDCKIDIDMISPEQFKR